MTIHTYPIVGAYYRPPAQAILAVLPAGAKLIAYRDTDNPHDHNATAVAIPTANIPEECHIELGLRAEGFGFYLADILAQPKWHLGYIPAKNAQILAGQLSTEATYPGSLTFTINGKPAIQLELPNA